MASSSSNSTNESPIPVGITTSRLDQLPARFSQKFITGKVIRLQANLYVFVCNHCDAEFRSPNSFLQHCEMHYLSTPAMMPYFPSNHPSSSFPDQISPSSYRVPNSFGNQNVPMPSLPSLPSFNSYTSSSPHFQARRWLQLNSMAYSNQSSIAPRQTNSSSWSDCCSPISGTAQAQSSQNVMQTGGVDYYQQQMQSTQKQSELVGMSTNVANVRDDDIYEIYDLGYDESFAVASSADSGEPKKIKRSKSKMSGPYICKICSKSYNRRGSLTRHYRGTHKQTPNESRPNSTA